MIKFLPIIFLVCLFCACDQAQERMVTETSELNYQVSVTSLVVLGTVQDAGSPHIACKKECCRELFLHPDKNRKVVSLGLIDPQNRLNCIIEATPDLPEQMKILKEYDSGEKETTDAIFLTHAHIGHYSGLMYLGKEAMNARKQLVYAMPRMKAFLETNGPWDQLVQNENILVREMIDGQTITFSSNLQITPFPVPHRDEYSETVGYEIKGPNKSALFIPDIDKWEKWKYSIIEEIAKVDYAFVDGTFYDAAEINHRDISEIPHSFIIESMKLFAELSASEKKKIYFIHLNHTNPALNCDSDESKLIEANGFNIGKINQVFKL